MSTNEAHEGEPPVSPSLDPSLPCIVDGAVAIQMERQASVRQGSLDDKGDSGVDEEIVSYSRRSPLYRQPITEETIYATTSSSSELCPHKPGRRKSSVDHELSSQESCSPLHSPRDPVAEGTEAMSPFYTFLHSKGLGDCCQYFPREMALTNFARLTEYELINLYDIQSSHAREVVIHTIQSLDKLEDSHNEDEEVEALHNKRSLTISGSSCTPPRSPSPRKFYDASDVPSVISRRLLHRTLSEDMKGRRRRDSMPHSHSSHTLNTLSPSAHSHTQIPIQILLSPIMQQPIHTVHRRMSVGCGSNSDFSNLIKMRNSLLGHSAPNLSSSLKDLSISRRNSGRSATSTPKKMSIVHPRCVSPQTSAMSVPATKDPAHFASPIDFKPLGSPLAPGSPLTPQCVQNLKPSYESRRWSFASYASSGYSTTTAGSNMSLTSSMEKVNPFFSGHDHLSAEGGRDRFSSSESNPAIDDDSSSSLLPLPRPRSRSFSPTRAMPMDADSTFMMNSLYRERFPKAVRQMEEKLRQFITENTFIQQSDEGDGTLRFVHKQIVTLAQDCLDKCCTQLLSALYFHELSENLRTLSNDVKSRASPSFLIVDKMIKNLLMIVSRTARLLECLEFDPDEFYCLLEQAEGQAKKTINTSDIPKYIISKLCLNRDPLEPILPEEFDGMDQVSLDDDSSFTADDSSDNKFRMKAPVEEDFDYIKQISNGAYGVVWLVRNKYNNQRFALKKLLKANLVLRNQVEQVFTERDILTFADNPFVVSLYGSFETKKHLCLVMEYVEGGDCAALLKNMGPLPIDMARMYFAETVLALEYIHDYGIVHRDLKPDNLLITNEGHIKLTDFGLSKMGIMNLTTNLVEGILDRESKQFSDRQIFGTPEYIAPEVILREGYGKPVDWWSMGIILYEFLVGCVPFYGDTPEELFQMVLTGEIEFPAEEEYALPLDAQDLILRLLERDPLKRLGTTGAREVIEHMFLNDIDWDSLLRQKVEFIPDLEGEEDTSYFDLRADRFPQHNEYDDDSDEDIMISSFSSCSPRYSKVYQKVHEMKSQQEHESLSRQSSGSSSVFGGLTHISSDSGSESPRAVSANEKITPVEFSFDKSVAGTPPEFLKSSLKSNTSTPKRSDQNSSSIRRSSAKDEDDPPSDISEVFSKRSASRSVSFDSEISALSCRDSLTSSHLEPSPLVTPTSPSSPSSSLHKMLRRSDALGPTAAEIIQRKDEDGDDDAFDEHDGQISSAVSTVTTPDSVFPSAFPTPIQYDVIPSTSSYTPIPVSQALLSISVITTPVFPNVTDSLVRKKPIPNQLSLSLPASVEIPTNKSRSTTNNAVMPISFTQQQAPTETPVNLPQWPGKPYLQITSSSDSASSSSANNSPGSNMAQKSYRKNRPGSTGRLQRNKHPGNIMSLAKVTEKTTRPRSRTSPDINFGEDFGERHRSLPEVSISASSPSPPAATKTADAVPRRFHSSHKPTLFAKGATNSCPVPVPASHNNKSMFVKSASATQLSLLIPPPSEEFNHPPPNVLLSPTSSASSRDQSPTRDALRRPPYILKKGARGYGFCLKAIRVYSGDGHYYHLNHLVTAVTEGSAAYQAGIRPNFLVTHINNEPVHGLPQPQIVRLIQKNSNMVTLRALPIEETSLKPGVKPPSELRKAKMVTRKAAKKRQSFSKVDRRRQRSSSLLKTLSKRNAESLVQPTYDGSRAKSPRSPRLPPPDWGLSQSFSSSSVSPLSSGPNSPANSFTSSRPGTLQGLSKSLQSLKPTNRRKSVHNIPLSPLARTPSPSPMAISPTLQNPPPSKLAVGAVQAASGPCSSTLTFKHSPRLSRSVAAMSSCIVGGEVSTSLTNALSSAQGTKTANVVTAPNDAPSSPHNSVIKTGSTQSDPGTILSDQTALCVDHR